MEEEKRVNMICSMRNKNVANTHLDYWIWAFIQKNSSYYVTQIFQGLKREVFHFYFGRDPF